MEATNDYSCPVCDNECEPGDKCWIIFLTPETAPDEEPNPPDVYVHAPTESVARREAAKSLQRKRLPKGAYVCLL